MRFIIDFWDGLAIFLGAYPIYHLINVFWYYFYFELPRYFVMDVLVIGYRKIFAKKYARKFELARRALYREMPLVSVICPGKNEGKHLYNLIRSLSEQTWQNYELIFIDDGSDDDTKIIAETLSKRYPVTFLHVQDRGGKASAANLGLRSCRGKYVVHLDADSSLDRNAIENILVPFYIDPKIKAVGGSVKVRNSKDSMCTTLQSIEYMETIMVGRTVTSTLGIYRTISGAFGAFELDVLKQVGGWDIGPGLDGDITMKIRKAGYKIYFEEKAVCLTNVPTTWKALAKQRLRWSKSLIRFRLRKHFSIFRPDENFSFPNFFSSMDNIIFNLVFDILWFVFLINLIFTNSMFLLQLFILKLIIFAFTNTLKFWVAIWLTERKSEEKAYFPFVFLMSIYAGYFLRCVRTLGYVKEFFFFSSYRDAWNPRKTSEVAEYQGL